MPLATAAGKGEGEGGLAYYRVHLATGTAPFPSPDCRNPSVRYPVKFTGTSHESCNAPPTGTVPGLLPGTSTLLPYHRTYVMGCGASTAAPVSPAANQPKARKQKRKTKYVAHARARAHAKNLRGSTKGIHGKDARMYCIVC